MHIQRGGGDVLELSASTEPAGWVCSGLCGAGCGAACGVSCAGVCAADGPIPILDSASWKLGVVGGGGGLSTAYGWVKNY